MLPAVVVVTTPRLDRDADLGTAAEPFQRQALAAE